MHIAVENINNTPSIKHPTNDSPAQVFSNSRINLNLSHIQHFTTPIHVLDRNLQDKTRIFNKWKSLSKIGLYLGKSRHHARSVALVINLQTGHVSPQFHVTFDPTFETDIDNPPNSRWQIECGFEREKRQNNKVNKTTEIEKKTNERSLEQTQVDN